MPGYVIRQGRRPPVRPVVAKKILMLGDSKPRGQGAPPIGDPQGALFDGIRYFLYRALLARRILVTFVGPFAEASSPDVATACGGHHGAVGGSTISDCNSTAAARIAAAVPDLIILDTMTNDVDGGAITTAAITANYTTLMTTVRGAAPTTPVIMVKCIPLLSANGVSFMASAYSQLDALYASLHATDANLYYCDCSSFPAGMMSTRFDGNPDLYHSSLPGYMFQALNFYLPTLLTIPGFG